MLIEPSTGQGKTFARLDELSRFLGDIGERKAREITSEPWFPRPIALGPRIRIWDLEEVTAALRSRPREEPGPEPTELLRGRIERMKRTGSMA